MFATAEACGAALVRFAYAGTVRLPCREKSAHALVEYMRGHPLSGQKNMQTVCLGGGWLEHASDESVQEGKRLEIREDAFSCCI